METRTDCYFDPNSSSPIARLFTQVHLLIDSSVEGQYITPDHSLNWTMRSSAILAGQWLLRAHPAKRREAGKVLFVSAFHQTGLDTRSMTQKLA